MKAEMNVSFKPFKGQGGLVGFVTLELTTEGGKLWITDLTAREGQNGLFVAMPSKKLKEPKKNEKTGKMEEYKSLIFGHRPVTDWITNEVKKQMGGSPSGSYQNTPTDDLPF